MTARSAPLWSDDSDAPVGVAHTADVHDALLDALFAQHGYLDVPAGSLAALATLESLAAACHARAVRMRPASSAVAARVGCEPGAWHVDGDGFPEVDAVAWDADAFRDRAWGAWCDLLDASAAHLPP